MFKAGSIVGELVLEDGQWVASIKNAETSNKKLTSSVFKAQIAVDLLKKGVTLAIKTFKDSVKAYAAQEQVLAKLMVQTNGNTAAIENWTASIQDATMIGDETAQQIASLGMSMGITQDKLEDATKGAIGLSEAFKVDLQTSMKLVALANEGEYGMLARYIPALRTATTEAEKHAIVQKAMADGYELAEARTDTFTGRLVQLNNVQGDTLEAFGQIIAVVGKDFVEGMISATKAFNDFITPQKSDTLFQEQVELNTLVDSITNVNTSNETRKKLLKELDETYPNFLGNLDKEKVTNEELRNRLIEVNKAYLNRIMLQKMQEEIDKVADKTASKKIDTSKEELKLRKDLQAEAIRLGLSEQILGQTIEKQIEIVEKSINKNSDSIMVYAEYSTRLETLKRKQNGVIESETKLTEKQEERKQLLESLGIKEEDLITLTTKRNKITNDAINTDKKDIDIKNKKIEKIEEETDEEKKAIEERKKILESWEGEHEKTYDEMIADINKKKEEFISAGISEVEAEKWAANKIAQIENDKNNAILDGMKNVVEAAKKGFSTDLGNSVADAMGRIGQSVMNGLGDVFEGLKKIGENARETAAGILEIVGAVGQVAADIFREISDLQMEQMEEGLANMEEEHAIELEEMDADKEEKLALVQDKYDQELEALDIRLSSGVITEAEYDAQKTELTRQKEAETARISDEAEKKKKEKKKKQREQENEEKKRIFEANKTNQIAMIWIQAALGIVSAWANAMQLGPIAGLIMGAILTALIIAMAVAQTVVISTQQFVPEKAEGGIAGGITRVNEEGGEVITLPDGSQVIPNDISRQIAAASGGGKNITINMAGAFSGATISNELDLDYIADVVIEKMGRKIETNG